MRDIYTESVVPVPAKPINGVLKYVFMALIILSVIAAIVVGLVFILPAIVAAYFLYSTLQKTDSEYEYVHTNNCFDVDLVVSNAKRKNLLSLDLERVILVAPATSSEMATYDGVPEKDYSGTSEDGTLYAMVYTESGKPRKLLLWMDPNMLRSLKQWMPGKVK